MISAIKYPITILLSFITYLNFAAVIKGTVKDAHSNEPLIGALIKLKENQSLGSVTDFEGNYSIKNIPEGQYTILVQYVGYVDQEKTISITAQTEMYEFVFSMQIKHTEEIVIQGSANHHVESDTSARASEKNADNVLNIVSADAIRRSPDITVANVLQRVSGVSIERSSNGEGRYAIVRGMDPRYNYTLVNGVKIPSPDNKNRYVPMDLFPSDILERLEVVKALIPSMEGDAIGGVVNMVMKSAPDKPMLNVNGGGGLAGIFFNQGYKQFDQHALQLKNPNQINGPNYVAKSSDFSYTNFDYKTLNNPMSSVGGISMGKRFLKKRLGIVLAGSYQNTYRGAKLTYFVPEAEPNPGTPSNPNVPAFSDIYVRTYSTQQKRMAIHSKIDYVFNPRHKISLYGVYIQMNELQTRHTIDTSLELGRYGYGTGSIYFFDRSRLIKQSIFNTTLQGEHKFWKSSFTTNWSAVYSIATNDIPDWSEVETYESIGPHPVALQLATYMNRIWQSNVDDDHTGYLNFTWDPYKAFEKLNSIANKLHGEISFGGLYRHKYRNNYYNEYQLNTTGNSVLPLLPYRANQFFFISNQAAQGSSVNPNIYTANEDITATYAQLKLMFFNRLQALGGVRFENTYQAYQTAENPQYFVGAYGTINYNNLLPSAHLKYILNRKQNLRASYFESLSRPSFFEIVPYNILGDIYSESGNPYLRPTIAHNFDLRYELFGKGLDQLLIGTFYKKLVDPIELAYVTKTTTSSSSGLMPENFGTATNYGFELVLTKYIGHFGINTNYTYTHSSITTTKLAYYVSNNTEVTTNVNQTRPLQGQSANIANVSLLYNNTKLGIETQLAYVYTGRRINQVSPYYDMDYWQKATNQVDFSIEKRFAKKFSVYAKIGNILNTPLELQLMKANTSLYHTGQTALPEQTAANYLIVQKEYYKQTYLFGIRYKF
jgi:outer membrane cobalamin receptor